MTDRSISATIAASLAGWIVGFVLILLDLFTSADLGNLGLFVAGGGAVLTIRHWMVDLSGVRERNAFMLGCDYTRDKRIEDIRAIR